MTRSFKIKTQREF